MKIRIEKLLPKEIFTEESFAVDIMFCLGKSFAVDITFSLEKSFAVDVMFYLGKNFCSRYNFFTGRKLYTRYYILPRKNFCTRCNFFTGKKFCTRYCSQPLKLSSVKISLGKSFSLMIFIYGPDPNFESLCRTLILQQSKKR